MPGAFKDVYEVVSQIPRGRVTTYGRIAAMTAVPSGARGVGWALAGLSDESDTPWWRVVGAAGRITNAANLELQRELLRAEGIVVDASGGLDLAAVLWEP